MGRKHLLNKTWLSVYMLMDTAGEVRIDMGTRELVALLTRLLTTMLHDVEPMDGSVFAGTAAALLGVLLASYLPARAAGRVDAMVVLRDA